MSAAPFPGLAELHQAIQTQALRTTRLVRLFQDGDMELKPADGSWSTAEQVAHVCASRNFLRALLSEEPAAMELFHRQFDCSTADKAVAALNETFQELQVASASLTADAWNETIEPFGPQWSGTRGYWILAMLDHETHHRGQLHVYARLAGITPPMLYAPVEELAG